ncbi:MAG: hypothetical protein HGA38_01985 [Candidatus Moranbacteria bacterium]|nr:hypothetical protein [Candidatus Moranbacteria bacterium]
MKTQTPTAFLERLNRDYVRLHRRYERLFWTSYMGDHSMDARKDQSQAALDDWRNDPRYREEAARLSRVAGIRERKRLLTWVRFFDLHQLPPEAIPIKREIDRLESDIFRKRAHRKEGYVDPDSGRFVKASWQKMRTMMATHEDEPVRKACFEGAERLAYDLLDDYVRMIGLRNRFARILGYEDYYDLRLRRDDGMTKDELFGLFDDLYEQVAPSFGRIRDLEKTVPGLRKPWNFSFMMSGDFTREEEPYLGFEDALLRWGKSFAAMGVRFRGGRLTLDLLDRDRKYDNGFCHWPDLVRYDGERRIPGSANFTCNVVPGQIGSGANGYRTLFHEGAHAAHLLTASNRDVILNHEYPPMSTPWAETQSQFFELVFNDIEWRARYAKDADGKAYPFDLFERKTKRLSPIRPFRLNSIMLVSEFERRIYEADRLTSEEAIRIAKECYRKYNDHSVDSVSALNVPHIFSLDSSATYHAYGLSLLAVAQWREYFYRKYGYIVDNPAVGREMARAWKFGAARSFTEFVTLATGKPLSPDSFLRDALMTPEQVIRQAKRRLKRLESVPLSEGRVRLDADMRLVDGKRTIATNAEGFERMSARYRSWILRKRGASEFS